MNIPDKVKIGGFIYDVKITDDVDITNMNIDGRIIYSDSEIRIHKRLKDRYKESVFLHEIVHGIFDFCNISFEETEDIVERLSQALYQVITDNPEIFNGE